MTVGNRIKMAREAKQMTQEELGATCGTTKQSIFKYESGVVTNIPLDRLEKIAAALDVSPAYLMGWDEPEQPKPLPPNITPLPAMKEWQVLGATACGKPLHRELLDETILAPADIKADIVFRCVGDSMINARIFDGDAVFIHLQPEVENGQIAVVRVGDEYTLKRVYVFDDYVELRAENPTVKTILLRGQELEPDNYEVVGLAVAFLSTVL